MLVELFIGRRAGQNRKVCPEGGRECHAPRLVARPRTRWPRTGASATSPDAGAGRRDRARSVTAGGRAGSSCSGTGPAGCTTTSGWRSTACWSAGPCRRARRWTRRCGGRRSTSRTTRWSTSTSRASSRPASTAAATSSCGTTAPGSRTSRATPATRSTRWPRRDARGPVRREAARPVRAGADAVDGAGKEQWLLLHKQRRVRRRGLGRRGPSAFGAVRPHQRRGQGRPGPAVALGPAGRAGRGRPEGADGRAGRPATSCARWTRSGRPGRGRCSAASCG